MSTINHVVACKYRMSLFEDLAELRNEILHMQSGETLEFYVGDTCIHIVVVDDMDDYKEESYD